MVRLLLPLCVVAAAVAVAGGDSHATRVDHGRLVSLSIVPSAQSIAVGDRLRLAVLARYEDGWGRDLAGSAHWTSSAPTRVRVVGDGVVAGAAEGKAVVVARIDGAQVSTAVHVGQRSLGPLRVSSENPRYFVDRAGRVVYLAGDHTWEDLVDVVTANHPQRFDYPRFLDYLQTHGLRVFELWAWEQGSITGPHGDFGVAPTVYARTGPGVAIDGKPRFDLERFDATYFARLRGRVIAARERGIYAIVMLFNGWSIERKGEGDNPWRGHPYNRANNINGVDGDPAGDGSGRETHTLADPRITRLQEAYVARVIRAVGDQPNVLYEISNESSRGSLPWQEHMVHFIRAHEPLSSRAPIGITAEYPGGRNDELVATDADWIGPNGDIEHLTPSSGRHVVFADTDHLCGVCADTGFPWRAFTLGLNPMFMDPYDGPDIGLGPIPADPHDPRFEVVRRRLGATETLSEQLDMGKLAPRGDLSSTGYCLADATHGTLYVVYLPDGGSVSVDVSAARSSLRVTWVDPDTGVPSPGGTVAGGGIRSVRAPGQGAAVLVLRATDAPAQEPSASPN